MGSVESSSFPNALSTQQSAEGSSLPEPVSNSLYHDLGDTSSPVTPRSFSSLQNEGIDNQLLQAGASNSDPTILIRVGTEARSKTPPVTKGAGPPRKLFEPRRMDLQVNLRRMERNLFSDEPTAADGRPVARPLTRVELDSDARRRLVSQEEPMASYQIKMQGSNGSVEANGWRARNGGSSTG